MRVDRAWKQTQILYAVNVEIYAAMQKSIGGDFPGPWTHTDTDTQTDLDSHMQLALIFSALVSAKDTS